MFKFEKPRVEARRKLLTSKDILSFENVPSFITKSLGSCTYQSRLTVSTFCVLNGISYNQCLELYFFKALSAKDIRKNGVRYYFYCVHYKKVLFLNGDLRLHGKRIVNHNLFQKYDY